MKRYFLKIATEICPSFVVRPEQKTMMNDIFLWCLMAEGRYNPHKGLWLWGDIGTGKTTLLHIVKRFCHDIRPKVNGEHYSFRISNAIEVCGCFASQGYEGIETFIGSRRQAFDELGSESSPTGYYGTAENVFQYILQRRYDKRFSNFTHVTTNISKSEIARRYSPRIYDRCKEMFNFVEMRGKTFRNE